MEVKKDQHSSLIALKSIKKFKPNSNVLIHDAARPNFSIKTFKIYLKD